MKTFNEGDRVHHAHHGSATVTAVEEDFNLVTIRPDFYRDGSTVSVHPISLTHTKTEPKFHVLYRFTHGNSAKSSMIPMNRQQTEAYLTNYPNWDNIESITITRAKG